jgi:predicted RND superfamily exporter protein
MQRLTSWMQAHPGLIIGVALAITGLLAIPFLTMAPTVSASTEPEGPVFEARDLVEERFASSVYPIFFIVSHDGGDLVSKNGLTALLEAEESLRGDPELGPTLIEAFDPAAQTPIDGMLTIADIVDSQLPGGLSEANDQAVRAVAAEVINQLGPASTALGLSTRSEIRPDGTWEVPAISFPVLADNDVLGFGGTSISLGGGTEAEEYNREVQEALRSTDELTVRGVAIDVNLTSQEQGALAGPFIGFTILAVLLIVGITFRSYWVLAIVGAALGALMIWLKGISNLIGLEDDLVLSLIVPIAMVSFGVDFAFHAIGRYREERRDGLAPGRAFVVGLAAVSGALVLALASDTAAFLANVSSGIESIIQFGVGAAIALVSAFLLLGIVAPLAVSLFEERLPGPASGRRSILGRVVASMAAGSLVMASVLLMVFVLPWAGVIAYGLTLLVTLVLPYGIVRRRHGDAPIAPVDDDVDRLARPLGSVVAALAGRRWIVLPIALGLSAVAAVYAVQVPAEFDVEDFFSSDSEFVVSLDTLDEHVGDRGGEPARLYVEGPLDEPAALAQLSDRIDEVRALDSDVLARGEEGVRVERGVFSVFDAVFASPTAIGMVEAETGVIPQDDDADGIPDTSEQVRRTWP